jgi:hypothetical protein
MEAAMSTSILFVEGRAFTDDHQTDIRGLITALTRVRPELPLSRVAG